jgi:hypothetical protein
MQTARLGAPWKYATCLENLVLQAMHFQTWDFCFLLSGETPAGQNYGSGDGDGF